MMKRIRIICSFLLIALLFNSLPAAVYADDSEDAAPVCGDILSSDEFVSSIEPFDFTEYDEDGNPISGAIVIPDSVDHSTSPYFPAIVSQGQLSCMLLMLQHITSSPMKQTERGA